MIIYRVFNNETSLEGDCYQSLETAFAAAEREIDNKYAQTGQLMTMWYENDNGDWEAWIITRSQYEHQEFKAEVIEFEVQRIEVF